jgi:hypothetical protein
MPKEKYTASEAEQIELRYKQLQIEELEERIADRRDQKERMAAHRERQVADFKKGEAERLRRQAICRHRKGGKDNRFAQGNAQNYSVNMNTYPTGRMVIFCTRCGKEVEKPDLKLRKTDPEKYKTMAAEWNEWSRYPTDNQPSGGKIFEIIEATNAA